LLKQGILETAFASFIATETRNKLEKKRQKDRQAAGTPSPVARTRQLGGGGQREGAGEGRKSQTIRRGSGAAVLMEVAEGVVDGMRQSLSGLSRHGLKHHRSSALDDGGGKF
jgi:fructose-1,6-bisphosphatase/inositol monophosphatase family enzyme